jgi:predicted permease
MRNPANELKLAVRSLAKRPGYAAIAAFTLALGIGANVAIFSLVDEVLVASIPVAHPERLFFVDNSGGKSGGSNGPPYPCYELMRDRTRQLSGLAMFAANSLRVTIDGSEERVHGQYASGNYFAVLGVRAARGRVITAADDAPGGGGGPDGPVVVISDRFWKRRFGANPSVIGAHVQLGGRTMTIVGVTPPEFFGLTVGAPVDMTVPVTLSDANLSETRSWWFSLVGRLADGATADAARAELDAMFRDFMTSTGGKPPTPTDYFSGIALVPASRGLDEIRHQFSTPLAVVMAIVALLLVVGCANVANLLLARASAREQEMTLRLAIGASRGRLVRQLLTEGLMLGAFAGVSGLGLAKLGAATLVHMVEDTRQQIALTPRLDNHVLWFAAGVALITGVLCSLAPALTFARRSRAATGSPGRLSASRSQRRVSQALIVVQVAVSLVLLGGAALFVRTLRNLETADAGFRSAGVLAMPIQAVLPNNPPEGMDRDTAIARIGAMWQDLATRTSRLPGVESAAAATLLPMGGHDRGVDMAVVGGTVPADDGRGVRLNQVTASYFATLGVRVLDGRAFQDTDGDARFVVLGRTAARAYFGDVSPVGRSVTFNGRSAPFQVVGVVEDTQYETLRAEPARLVYLPLSRPLDVVRSLFLAIRTTGATGPIAAAVRDDVRRSIPQGFVGAPATLTWLVQSSLLQERLVSLLSIAFGSLAALLAGVGLYGLLSYVVVRRTREFGVRMAIGAPRSSIVWLVLRETAALLALAFGAGVLVIVGLGRYVQALLYQVTPEDPIAMGAAIGLLAAVALTAAFLPAWRASAIEPTTALRQE